MLGTILNVGAILVGGGASLVAGRQLSPGVQQRIKLVLGVLTIYVGFKTVWQAIHGTLPNVIKQTVIVLGALVLGNLVGKMLRLQRRINALGDYAKGAFRDESS